MYFRLSLVAIAFLFVGLPCALAQSPAGDWPQWRGPLGTGVAPGGNPPTKWDQNTNIQWKVRIPGDGTSTPIIWGDKVFVQSAKPTSEAADAPPATAFGKGPPPGEKGKGPPPGEKGKGGFGGKGEFGPPGGKGGFGGGKGGGGSRGSPPPTEPYQFLLLCLDRQTGKTLWQRVVSEQIPHEGKHPADGSFSASSAITDGECVISFFGSRGLYCYDLAGNLKWQKDLGDQKTRNGFGEGATPALYGNTVIVPWDHEGEDFIVVFDKRTGDELWRKERDEPTGWSTPLVVEHGGQAQVITCGTNRIRSYDLATGRQLWEHEGLTTNAIPTPVTRDGIVYATSGYQGSKLFAIRLGATGDLTGTKSVLWSMLRDTPYVPSPLLSGDRLYFLKSNNAILTCLNIQDGKPHYAAQRIEGLQSVYASPVAAAGRVYLTGRDGTTVVIKDGEKLEQLATNPLGERIDATPAIVGNQLFLRGHEHLYCIAEK